MRVLNLYEHPKPQIVAQFPLKPSLLISESSLPNKSDWFLGCELLLAHYSTHRDLHFSESFFGAPF